MKNWKSVEIINNSGARDFEDFLKRNGYEYTSEIRFNYVHFEVYCDKEGNLNMLDFLHDLATK